MFRVMIADDEPIVRKALQVLTNWESIDCQIVYIASDGQEVIDNIANTNPDIIVTDIKMPGMDGLSIAKYIKEKGLPIKVIILTAYADFSYAKTALQYGVVDYVTKDGAFDGLLNALESAKKILIKERKSVGIENQTAVVENFFKSLIDGSIYDEEEIYSKAEHYGVSLKKFMLLLFCFRVDANMDHRKKEKIHSSLLDFFGMVFNRKKIYIVSVKRNLLCVLLDDIQDTNMKDIKDCCNKIINIVKNFMKLDVHIGGSLITSDLKNLKVAYNEAEIAVSQSFYSQDHAVHFYAPHFVKSTEGQREYQQYIDEICDCIRKGENEKALDSFEKLFHIQSENRVPVETIKGSGMFIESCCRRYLLEYDTTIAEVMHLKKDFSQIIYDCFQMEEFHDIMIKLIDEIADFIAHSVDRKNIFIHECEKIIKENVERNISVSEIAERMGVSGSYLSRIFKEKTGSTVINAINRVKLETAQDLLKNTDMKIYEIADRLGFENITYFSHFFKKHMHISPVEYKKKVVSESKGN